MNHKILQFVCISGLICSAAGCQSKSNIQLKKDTFQVEYGDRISTKASMYIKGDKAIVKDTEITIKKLKYEKDKKYPKEGTYSASATYKDESLSFQITVKDTKKPVFKSFLKEIRIEQNAENFSIEDFYQADDLHSVKISSKLSTIKWDTPGTYKGTVIAADSAGNKSTKTMSVIILSSEEVQNGAELTANSNGKYFISKATQAHIDKHELEIHTIKPDGTKETIGSKQVYSQNTDQQFITSPSDHSQNTNNQPAPAPTPDPTPEPDPTPTTHYTLVKTEEIEDGLTRFHFTFKEGDHDIAMKELRAWLQNQGYVDMRGGAGPTFGYLDAKKN